uniref:ORF193 n=1 Tax=Sciadococcus taiwanensis TaxID=3028030 RepID=A0A9Y1I234_9RHOD|nr:ORF193 [Sciadococcus taiwanensis]
MMKKSRKIVEGYLGLFIILGASLFFFVIFWITQLKLIGKSYRIYIEFNNAAGVHPGTLVRYKGSSIGKVTSLFYKNNNILTAVEIRPTTIIVPKNSFVEANQSGLLSETIIDITPLNNFNYLSKNSTSINPLSKHCNNDIIICNESYIKGYKGLNYDDLVRATTRISQRFDDPNLFENFNLLLQNTIDLTDNLAQLSNELNSIMQIIKSQIEDITK